MRKTILLICISLMTLGLWGCSVVPVQQEPVEESDITTESINEVNNSANQNNQDGDELEDGNFYFDEVAINSYNDAVTFLKKYNLYKEDESYFINFETPKYYGLIIYELETDNFTIIKNGENFYQEYTYSRDGIVDSNCWETDNNTDDTKTPVVLAHGVKIDDTTVYIDPSIESIEKEQNISGFFDLIEKYFGVRDPDTSYTFVAAEDAFTVSKMQTVDGHKVIANVSNELGGRSEHHFEYTESQKLIQHIETAYDESGNAKYRIWEKDGDAEKQEWFDDGIFVRTTTKNGTTTVVKQKDSLPFYYYKSNWQEAFFTYNGSGILIGYKAISLKDGEVYDWVLDGNGLEPENFVSVTITKNGYSKTYVGKNEIPWGAAIFYPPKSNGSYE